MNIVAIGGGERTSALRYTFELSGAEKPHVLIIPSACSTEKSFNSKVPRLGAYLGELGVTSEVLHDFNETPTRTKISHEIGRASLLYTLGGYSPFMLETLRAHGTDEVISQAIFEGKPHAGTSAGALLPFELAHSCVAKNPAKEEWDYAYLRPLGIIPGVATAHGDQHDPTPRGLRPDSRLDALVSTFPQQVSVGYAIDNHAAAVFSTEAPQIIRTSPDANVHILRRDDITLDLTIAQDDDLWL